MGDPIKQLALTSLALPHAFLENQRQQPTFLWEITTLKTNKHRELSAIYSLWQWGYADMEILVWSRTLSCGAWMTHLIMVYTQRSFLMLQCQLPQSFSVSCLIFFIHILTSLCHTHLFYCGPLYKPIHCGCGVGSLPRKGTGLRCLISSYQTFHPVRLFCSLHGFFPPFPPQSNKECNLCCTCLWF